MYWYMYRKSGKACMLDKFCPVLNISCWCWTCPATCRWVRIQQIGLVCDRVSHNLTRSQAFYKFTECLILLITLDKRLVLPRGTRQRLWFGSTIRTRNQLSVIVHHPRVSLYPLLILWWLHRIYGSGFVWISLYTLSWYNVSQEQEGGFVKKSTLIPLPPIHTWLVYSEPSPHDRCVPLHPYWRAQCHPDTPLCTFQARHLELPVLHVGTMQVHCTIRREGVQPHITPGV